MRIPFTIDQFFSVFAQYNSAIWPAQVVAYLLAIAAVALVFRNNPYAGRVMSGTLGVLWVWMGAVYHIGHFTTINPAALFFGLMFIIQGVLFLFFGVVKSKLSFSCVNTANSMVGIFFILFAMAMYPLLGTAFGHHYPSAPVFGVAPCPTTIFTMGVLLCSSSHVPVLLLPIPFLWSIVGMSAAISLRVPQDYGLVVAGVCGTLMIVLQNRKRTLRNQAL